MKLTTFDYLNLVAPYFPPELISPAAAARIGRAAELLPPSSNFGFECRLGTSEPAADFLVAIIPSDGSRGAWSRSDSLADRGRAWSQVRGLLADWSSGDPRLAPLHDAWVELDLEESPELLPEPSFFFGFDAASPENHPALSLELVERLQGATLTPGRRAALERCFAATPPDAVIFQVGVMLSRRGQETRLCLRRLSRQGIGAYLRNIGWSGSWPELEGLMNEIAPFVDGINLDISVGGEPAPGIGLECVIRDGGEGRAKSASFLEYLAARGACLPEKGEAIFRWLGYSTENTERERWPAFLLKASAAAGDGVVSSFARTLNHFKISYQTGKKISAKVYLGVRHFWAQHKENPV